MAVIGPALPGNQVWGESNTQTILIQPTSSDYPAGGYILTPGQNGITLKTIYGAWLFAGGNGYDFQFTPSTNALAVFSTANTQVAASTDLSAFNFTIQLVGV